MATYLTTVADLTGAVIDEIPAGNLVYSKVLNGPGSASFTLPVLNPKCTRSLLEPGKREIHIWRDGVKAWGGYLWSASASDENDVRFSAEGYFSRLRKRYVDSNKNYDATEQLDIIWDLINWTQAKTNGALGITRASATASGITRDADYYAYERRYIGDIISEMASWYNGFDFEITPNKAWTTYFPAKGSQLPNVVFEMGKNVGGLSYDLDATDVANGITSLGSGEGQNICIATGADATSQDTSTGYGLLEAVETFSDIIHYADLQNEVTEELNMRKTARYQPQLAVFDVDTDLTSFSVGDYVQIAANHGYLTIDDMFRIISITVQIANSGREAVTVYTDDKALAGD